MLLMSEDDHKLQDYLDAANRSRLTRLASWAFTLDVLKGSTYLANNRKRKCLILSAISFLRNLIGVVPVVRRKCASLS